MKKHFFFIILLWICWQGGFARHVPADSAQKAAFHFLQQLTAGRSTARSMQSLQLVHQEVSGEPAAKARTAPLTYYYVFSLQETARAYPNPTSGELHIKTDKSFEYAELLSLTGQRIKFVPANSRTINLAELQNGMYLLRFKSKEGYQVQKIIKE